MRGLRSTGWTTTAGTGTFSLIDQAGLLVMFTSILAQGPSPFLPALNLDYFRMFIIKHAGQQIASTHILFQLHHWGVDRNMTYAELFFLLQ